MVMNEPLEHKRQVIALVSGGIDSTACLAFYQDTGFSITGLYVDYGHRASSKEDAASAAICNHYGIRRLKIACQGFESRSDGFIPGRNAFLLLASLMAFPDHVGMIALGIHSGTSYADCTASFVDQMQACLSVYTDGRVIVSAPFLDWTKREIWDYCRSVAVPLDLTYSCELGLMQPCGKCLSCKDLEALNAGQE